jgi:hypothetical protein
LFGTLDTEFWRDNEAQDYKTLHAESLRGSDKDQCDGAQQQLTRGFLAGLFLVFLLLLLLLLLIKPNKP